MSRPQKYVKAWKSL